MMITIIIRECTDLSKELSDRENEYLQNLTELSSEIFGVIFSVELGYPLNFYLIYELKDYCMYYYIIFISKK